MYRLFFNVNGAAFISPMSNKILKQVEKLTSIGISLSKERNLAKLLELIMIGAKQITYADGGTLYLVKGKQLKFEIMRTDSLDFAMGGTTGNPITLAPIPLFDAEGNANLKNISAYAAVTGKTANIADAYAAHGFDFQGTKLYDQQNNYRSQSFLTVPMRNHEDEIIGVLQLINAQDPKTEKLTAFSIRDQKLAESLASQAAIAITNFQLISDLRELLENFIKIIAQAIDEKSPYTGGHCRRVPEIAMMLADAINDQDHGPFKATKFSEQELYELNIAALLHDCGKITTPVHVVDKATKLETIFDRIELIAERVETLKKEVEIKLLNTRLNSEDPELIKQAETQYHSAIKQLEQDFEFICKANKGSEYMGDDAVEKIQQIARHSWYDSKGQQRFLLTQEEIDNLCIRKGTLTDAERSIVNHHIVMTQQMLGALRFPNHLKNVPEIAGNHHERMDGKGYPNGLQGNQLSVQARMMCIADVFEALTAADRPYKKAMQLSTAIKILGNMKQESHIDPDIFDVFVSEKVYLKYAKRFLKDEQIDEVDIKNIPGFSGLKN